MQGQLLSFSELLHEFFSILVKVYKNVHFTEFHSLLLDIFFLETIRFTIIPNGKWKSF